MSEQLPENVPFFGATTQADSRNQVFVRYLEYFRSRLAAKLRSLPESELRRSRLPSEWTPLELLKHLRFMERRWLVWGFEGHQVTDPWGDHKDDRWSVAEDESLDSLLIDLAEQAAISTTIINGHDLEEIGQPSERWSGNPPASLERVLFHMMQEYARHVGHLDIVTELATGEAGE